MRTMDARVLVGTAKGLWQLSAGVLQPIPSFPARSVTGVVQNGDEAWAILEGGALWHATGDDSWRERASIDGPSATCLASTPKGLLLGTEQAHLLQWTEGHLVQIGAFETVQGREKWHTPWGDPADVRSIAGAHDGTLYVNVHVGGVVRSRDSGMSWAPTIDVDADVHQVLTHPTHPAVVLVAAFDGFGVSRDGGWSWEFLTKGMHAHYARAVAVSEDTVLVSASTGPRGRRATLYRKPLDGAAAFECCQDGLPWFDDNINTACLVAHGALVVFGTHDGRVFRSLNSGTHWEQVGTQLPAVTAVTIG